MYSDVDGVACLARPSNPAVAEDLGDALSRLPTEVFDFDHIRLQNATVSGHLYSDPSSGTLEMTDETVRMVGAVIPRPILSVSHRTDHPRGGGTDSPEPDFYCSLQIIIF